MSKSNKSGIIAFFTVLLVAAMFMANYGNYQLAAIPGKIYETYHLTDAQFSSLMTGPMLPSIFLSIIIGILVDKFGVKNIVSICLIISLAGFILRIFVSTYTGMLIAMALTGFAGMVLNANISKIAASVYSPDKIGTMVGIFMAASTGSMAVAYGTTAMIPSVEIAFWIAAGLSIAVTVIWILFVKESYFVQEDAPAMPTAPVGEALAASFKSINIWLLGLSLMFMMGGAMIVANFHVGALAALKGYEEAYAGTFATVLMIGSLLGSIFVPVAASKTGRNTGVFILVITLIAGFCCIGITRLSTTGIYVASFLNGFLRSGTISVCMSLPVMFKEIGPRYAGTAGGLTVTLELLGAVIIPTYIIVPLAGAGNFHGYFLYGCVSMIISAVLAFIVIQRSKAFS